jgi:hypothetical protein
MDGGSHSDFDWAERPLHVRTLNAGGSLQLYIMKYLAGFAG